MQEMLKSELERLLDAYDQKQDEALREAQRQREEGDAFVDAFRRLRAEVIRPGMEEVGETLRVRGHEYRIGEDDEGVARDGRPRSARIILTVTPVRARSGEAAAPAVAFAASRRRRKVCVYLRLTAANDSSPRAEYDLDRITPGLVEAELLAALKEIFAK
jgi:hypothetical protein